LALVHRVGSAMVAAIAIDGTLRGWGPFGRWNLNDALLILQAFIGMSTTMMLSVAAEVSRRRDVERDLRRLNDDLEWTVTTRTDELLRVNERLIEAQEVAHVGSWEWDMRSDRVWWSDEMYRIYGMERGAAIGYDAFLARLHPTIGRVWTPPCGRRWPTAGHSCLNTVSSATTARSACCTGPGGSFATPSLRPIRMVGIGHDITERKEAEEARAQLIHEQARRQEAEESSRAKDQFLAILSHELRTPLNAALGWAHMLREMPRDAPATRHAVDTIYRNLLVQAGLVSDIVDISRITKGALAIESAPVESGWSDQWGDGHGARVRANPSDHARVPGQRRRRGPGRRRQAPAAGVLESALERRVRFGREVWPGGAWKAKQRRDVRSASRVEDDGPGSTRRFLLRTASSRSPGGCDRRAGRTTALGLGLAIARHLVELHGVEHGRQPTGPRGGTRS
jgi:PAS domain-containing protein